MQFIIKDDNGNLVQLPVNVKPAEGHKILYAHGAQGAFLGNYHFRIDFYQEMMPPLEFTEIEGKPKHDVLSKGVDRLIITSICIPIPFVKEMSDWLIQNITEYEKQFGEIKALTSIQKDETVEG